MAIFHTVVTELFWGNLVVIYSTLLGLGAGSFMLATLGPVFGIRRLKPIAKTAALLALIFAMVGPLFIIAEMGRPERFITLFFRVNVTSPMTWDVYIGSLFTLMSALYFYALNTGKNDLVQFAGKLGFLSAVAIEMYKGVLFGVIRQRPLWHSPTLPLVFLVSAITSSAALIILVHGIIGPAHSCPKKADEEEDDEAEEEEKEEKTVKESKEEAKPKPAAKVVKAESEDDYCPTKGEVISLLGTILAIFLAFELILVFSDMIVLKYSGAEGQATAKLLTEGSMSTLYIGGQVVVGLLIPLAILVFIGGESVATYQLVSLLVLIGVFAMKYVLIIGGQTIPLS
ncbi:MAG: polysulfide reductase NrfD [Candidatus Undinarchaeales archaeon]|jgi:tetrathionate reductase subunit C|nr:polysulfide reductase NrfD [Candidatus Undinarchaeales archaeon]MDP7491887.1 polysulfide reductase NrfD [Candidatus Undinarchaeales archaeon]